MHPGQLDVKGGALTSVLSFAKSQPCVIAYHIVGEAKVQKD